MKSFPVAFGPVYSRRLGRSLGVNLVPPKTCTWNCIYCYLGSAQPVVERRVWVDERRVVKEVLRILEARDADYVTLVGVGEPTLAANISRVIEALKREVGKPVAVLSNGSLFHRGVWEELGEADYVKATVTTWSEHTWRVIHEPAEPLNLEAHIEGVVEASRGLQRGIHLEVMLVRGVNDSPDDAHMLASVLRNARIRSIAVNAPRSPPRLAWVEPPEPSRILEYASILENELGVHVEVIALRPVKPPRLDPRRPIHSLLDIVTTHLVTLDEAIEALREAGVDEPLEKLEQLIEEGLLEARRAGGRVFLARGTPRKTR